MNTFTVEETNLLSIYKTDDKWEMLTNMAAALWLLDTTSYDAIHDHLDSGILYSRCSGLL